MDIFTHLLSLVHEKTAVHSKERVFLIDSSTFSLNKTRYLWGTFRPTKSGIKFHLKVCQMKEGWVHPEQFELFHASEHDHDHLKGFINEKRATYLTGLFRLVTIEHKHHSNLRTLTNRIDFTAEDIGKMVQLR